jgi:hypothetical protein
LLLESPDTVATIIDPKDAAESAGLRYVSDARPGIRRKKAGTGFSYIRADGSKLTEKDVLKRIKALAIPPAWTEVWICPFSDGHIHRAGWPPLPILKPACAQQRSTSPAARPSRLPIRPQQTAIPVFSRETWQRDLARLENRKIVGVLKRGAGLITGPR